MSLEAVPWTDLLERFLSTQLCFNLRKWAQQNANVWSTVVPLMRVCRGTSLSLTVEHNELIEKGGITWGAKRLTKYVNYILWRRYVPRGRWNGGIFDHELPFFSRKTYFWKFKSVNPHARELFGYLIFKTPMLKGFGMPSLICPNN